ncbi:MULTISPECIES: HNH endonuclease signature motif containing protein [unclassified Pseudomonas]|uniref:HNH endonuclease n=1 Tax=unclassified Pseudomonas TaxID=196821 RepID=UPI0005D3DB55|nr:HNH endonuclease signature motif containing protein [Pseudomonas sp. ES3-33]KJH78554.1 HNH endonuclease [Pseudomonas sp. ES3-33]
MDIGKKNEDWSEAEIKASVGAYLTMLTLEQKGQKFNKALENRLLRQGALADRTEGSVEFRMRNISTVLQRMGRDWIVGYKPATNVGANVEQGIREALVTDVFEPSADEDTLERRAIALEQKTFEKAPKGILKPKQTVSSRAAYIRDPEVRAWVRQEAKGICEGCGKPAPFEKDGTPFLEVHHVKHLAQKGSDRTSNAVALCPNCHRRCHHSNDREAFTLALYTRLKRLVRE